MGATLVSLLEKEKVPLTTLQERYGAPLALVETLLGVIPNCDPYLEIWPIAFRSYNVMVPNLLNLPTMLWGLGAPRATVGLAMYASSRAAECPYCSAHTCTFALRRGAKVDDVAHALDGKGLADGDRAAVDVARALSVVPAALDGAMRAELSRLFSHADAESLVLSIAMMGWLNKTMDALGVPLEEATVAEVNPVIASSGWRPGKHMSELPPAAPPPAVDSLAKRIGVIRFAPSAMALDKLWTQGVPDRWPDVGTFLREATGHDFPVLERLRHKRAVRAIAMMIRDNFTRSVVGKEEKLAAGVVYAETVQNDSLARQLRKAGARPVDDSTVQRLARAIAPSPAQVDDAIVESSRALQPAQIIEVVTFVALMQLLHRLETYYS